MCHNRVSLIVPICLIRSSSVLEIARAEHQCLHFEALAHILVHEFEISEYIVDESSKNSLSISIVKYMGES